MMSQVSWAMPSRRTGSQAQGRTSRSDVTPMFFIARTVAAMLTGSCGSKRTTEMRERRESDMRENESEQPVWLMPVTPKIDEFSGGTGHHELAAATGAARNDLVDEDVEEELRRAMVNVQRRVELIAG